MGKIENRTVDIRNLLINLENPRFDILNNQKEAISTMIQDQQEKLINLAEDISKDGLDPTSHPIIVNEPAMGNKYIVLEGNRRVVALKLLNKLESIPKDETTFKKKITNILKNYKTINEIECTWFEDESEAYKWIELRHTGESNGVGTVNWDAIQKERFQVKRGKSSVVIQAVDFVIKEADISEESRTKIKTMPITNLGRLLEDPDVRKELGVDIKEGNLVTNLPKDEVLKGLKKVVEDIANKEINVNDIYYKKDKINYINSIDELNKPRKDKRLTTSWALLSGPISSVETSKVTRSFPISTHRKKVIPRSYNLQISERRINNIFIELKRLKVDDFPNAGSVLLRVFIELSLDSFIEKNPSLGITVDDTLRKKITAVANHFEKTKIMNRRELKPIRQALSSKNELLSTETLNAYVHNKYLNPIPDDLKLTWDNTELFMTKIWS